MIKLSSSSASRYSVYGHVLRAAEAHGVRLRSASGTPPTGDEGALDASTFQASVNAMAVWCRVAERLVVANGLEGGFSDAVVHAGFERMSRVRPVLPRYRSIARIASSLDVYGEPDVELNVHGMREVVFSGGPLANEWFLLIESKRFKTILAGNDLDGIGGGKPLASRHFQAVACHHPGVVADVRAALELERDRLFSARPKAGGGTARVHPGE